MSDKADDRAEHHEEVHVSGKLFVEVPRALHFRSEICLPVFEGEVVEDGISDHSSSLYDAAYRRHGLTTFG